MAHWEMEREVLVWISSDWTRKGGERTRLPKWPRRVFQRLNEPGANSSMKEMYLNLKRFNRQMESRLVRDFMSACPIAGDASRSFVK
jgi:hypothetical protein